jgi:hypothetical protein
VYTANAEQTVVLFDSTDGPVDKVCASALMTGVNLVALSGLVSSRWREALYELFLLFRLDCSFCPDS